MNGLQDCSKYDIMISASLDGALSKKDARELEKHLAVCADCRKYLRLLETVKDGLGEDLPDPPETLREGIMYKIGLEKHRKLHFGAFSRWTDIAAVLCVVIIGVVKLTGSGVMKAASPEAAPAVMTGGAGSTSNGGIVPAEAPDTLGASKAAAPAPNYTARLTEGEDGAAEPETENAGGGANTDGIPGAAADSGVWMEPQSDSVYLAASLPGYDAARAALDSGEYWGVCLFYGHLPEGLSTLSWETEAPETGEKARWELSVGDLQALETDSEWNEFYYGDLSAGRGLVLVIAGEEE